MATSKPLFSGREFILSRVMINRIDLAQPGGEIGLLCEVWHEQRLMLACLRTTYRQLNDLLMLSRQRNQSLNLAYFIGKALSKGQARVNVQNELGQAFHLANCQCVARLEKPGKLHGHVSPYIFEVKRFEKKPMQA